MGEQPNLVWAHGAARVELSARDGGRVVSWMHDGAERVHPLILLEGGLFRILFAEEQYPGSSTFSPHQVLDWQTDSRGFRAHLRHYWNLSNWFMRRAGWPEKASELHVDGLVLDKILRFDAARSCLLCDLVVTNVSTETKYLTPWVHLSFQPWPAERWVVVGGKRQDYADTEIYWGSHLARRDAPMRMVHADAAGGLFAVLGAATEHLRGVCGLLPIPGEFLQSSSELRYDTIEIPPASRFRTNCFVALTNDWNAYAAESPEALYSIIEPSPEAVDAPCSTSLLEQWMLPAERERGLMALSFLDKPPFYSTARYAAANGFAGFHAGSGGASAHVMLYASRDLRNLTVDVSGGAPWRVRAGEGKPARQTVFNMRTHDFLPLSLLGPADLGGRQEVTVSVSLDGGPALSLRVSSDAQAEPAHPYHVRQMPAYLELRHREKLGPPAAATAEEFLQWQQRTRQRYRDWLEFNASGPCDLDPRLCERQEGPTCIREKWLIQTEPGIWVPGYLLRPRHVSGRRPLLFLLHGSGPGKDAYAGDETPNPVQTQFGHELEFMSYRIAAQLGCLIYVPDGRGQGELGETDPGRWTARIDALGLSNQALRIRDQVRAVDWLVQREDVDPSRIGSLGCSGGGGMTFMFAAADERIAASMAASTTPIPMGAPPPGFFHRMFADSRTRLQPHGNQPVAGAPAGMLVAPRPMWIMDGRDDPGIPAAQRPEWRRVLQEGRDAIRRAYNLLGAGERFVDTWFEGGHCAGMATANAVAWFSRWFNT